MENNFWERITPYILLNTGLTREQLPHSLEQQEETIIDFLSFYCYPENEVEQEIAQTKKRILRVYTNDIAKTITETEVYFHDLSAESVEAIFNLFQLITSAEIDSNISERRTAYDKALKFTYLVRHMVQLDLIKQYFKRIKSYKKMIYYCNHSGVFITNNNTGKCEPFMKHVSKEISVLKKKYRKSRRIYNKYFYRTIKTLFEDRRCIVRLDEVKEDIGLADIILQAKHINQLYIDNFPKIIGNGYNMSVKYRVCSGVLDAATIFFIICGFIKLVGAWDIIIAFLSQCLKG